VIDNAITANTPGGVLQSSFSLSTDNDGFTFTDIIGGFPSGPDGQWDSTDFLPPFDTHFKGQTDLGGGPTIFEETSAISPGNYNAKFQNAGANVWTVVAQGDFEYAGGTHPLHLDLLTALKDVSVADFDGAGIIAVAPDTLNAASIWFIPEPGSLVLASMGLIGIVVGRRRRF
ncbi:MAG: PEP-CTERM sorting domain-containing protein, partial [Planctomycetes bacterium]|nr:PEP-CTERM sorting domain-containing protein [Planctomycetota bacterium]